jgi:hypothetical protein
MNWINEPTDITKWHGFIYKITNTTNGRYYIGKKGFWEFYTLSPLKGRKNKRHKKKESNWKEYWGSCKELLEDVETLGKDKFEREIIRLCKTKWEWTYYELKEQIDRGVMFDKKAYNGIINIRLRKLKKYR